MLSLDMVTPRPPGTLYTSYSMINILIITIIITSVYSRVLRYKEMIMLEAMMKLPDELFRQELLPYLTVDDIIKLDNVCLNHKYRYQLLDKIRGVILRGDENKYIRASLFKWLKMRRIYSNIMMIVVSDFNFFSIYHRD